MMTFLSFNNSICMKTTKSLLLIAFLFFYAGSFAQPAPAKPDTVTTGIYVTSIHNIDFRQKEYTVSFWLWLKYKNGDFNFKDNLEVPQAKTITTSFYTADSSDGMIYLLMKMQCVMKDSWKTENFPFDRQKLRLSIENSQFDSRYLVFKEDKLGQHYDRRFTLRGWEIDSFNIAVANKIYETTFGDPELTVPHTEYSSFKVNIGIKRDAFGLFWKMFLGMYVSFLIAYICFYIHVDNVDARFGLSVGSLFAVIGNKYIIDSSLPESVSFTLVDSLHGITLLFIFAVITLTAVTIRIVKNHGIAKATRFDMIAAQVLLLLYLCLNIYFISQAM